jgi:hypothetical protein
MPRISDNDLLSHTFTIDFPIRKAVGGSVELVLYVSTAKQSSTGEIVFDEELHSPFNTLSDFLEIQLMNCDEIVYDFDDREFLFALGQLEIKVFDKHENLKRILFNSKAADYENDRCYLKFKPFDNSGEVIFEGYLDLESLHYDKKSKEISIQFFPNTGKLNDTPLYINGELNDKFIGIPNVGGVYSIGLMIEWIYKIVNPSVYVETTNHWDFYVFGNAFQFKFNDVFGSKPALTNERSQTYGDVLKLIAASFGAITGMLSSDRAIFKPFIGRAEDVIDVTDRLVSYEQLYSRNELKFITLQYRNHYPQSTGVVTSIESDGVTLSAEHEWYVFLGPQILDNREPITYAGMGVDFQLLKVFQSNYLANYFLNIESAKKDKIVIKGYGVEIFNDIKVEGTYYRPLSVIKKIREGVTEIEAVPIGFIFEDYDVSEPVELPPSGGVIGNMVVGEELKIESFTEGGTIVGTAYEFVGGSTRLYRNGIRQKLSEDYQELEGNHSVVLVEPMNEDEILLMDYVIKN